MSALLLWQTAKLTCNLKPNNSEYRNTYLRSNMPKCSIPGPCVVLHVVSRALAKWVRPFRGTITEHKILSRGFVVRKIDIPLPNRTFSSTCLYLFISWNELCFFIRGETWDKFLCDTYCNIYWFWLHLFREGWRFQKQIEQYSCYLLFGKLVQGSSFHHRGNYKTNSEILIHHFNGPECGKTWPSTVSSRNWFRSENQRVSKSILGTHIPSSCFPHSDS